VNTKKIRNFLRRYHLDFWIDTLVSKNLVLTNSEIRHVLLHGTYGIEYFKVQSTSVTDQDLLGADIEPAFNFTAALDPGLNHSQKMDFFHSRILCQT